MEIKLKDVVKQPNHYAFASIEVRDAIMEWGLNYCEGNIVKYVVRHRRKHVDLPLIERLAKEYEDLQKAEQYLQALIKQKQDELLAAEVPSAHHPEQL